MIKTFFLKAIYWNEYWSKKKKKKKILKIILSVDNSNNADFGKKYGKYEKT